MNSGFTIAFSIRRNSYTNAKSSIEFLNWTEGERAMSETKRMGVDNKRNGRLTSFDISKLPLAWWTGCIGGGFIFVNNTLVCLFLCLLLVLLQTNQIFLNEFFFLLGSIRIRKILKRNLRGYFFVRPNKLCKGFF